MRKTQALIQVAVALMADPQGKHWGYNLTKRSGVRSGVLYPILRRLLDEHWISDGWEDPATAGGRPPRRYYQLTELGHQELRALLAIAGNEPRFQDIIPGWAR
ncbi:PadR family transcriptional regulator [Actinophytocola sp.]|uniref:PadR family transcriptional regulator n=1 Tax=Actinophytocola sp. TaxID=1872138 RepID=UPI002D5D47BF|nr:helix-turn-helix transcriptional regulator [Actinophytocola sp.]HYQ68080.1 helix-turn-helix transcriptional regulator [Actinophytocola sp.]